MAGSGQKFRLRWDGFRSRLSSVFDELRNEGELLDVTLCCDGGHTVKAHRILLSASSPCLRQLLKEHPCQHPVFFLKDTSAEDLKAIIEFVYNGEVNVVQSQLASFIKTAELLQIRGLSGDGDTATPIPGAATRPTTASTPPPPPPPPPPPDPPRSSSDTTGGGQPPAKRRRNSGSGADSAPVATGDGAAGASGVIKTEQMDLSDAESAGLEDPLACISSYEDRHHSGSTAGPSSQRPVDSAASAVVLTPQGTGRGNAAGDQSAGPSGAAGTSHGAASLQERHLIWSQDLTSQQGLHNQDVLAVLDYADPQQITPRSSYARGFRQEIPVFESSDLELLGLHSGDDYGFPPLTMKQIVRPKLEVQVLPPYVLRKLAQHLPLAPTDWREMMQSIHDRYRPYDHIIRTTRNWYPKMAESIVNEFPFILPDIDREDAVNAVGAKLKHKFRNSRRPPTDKRNRREKPRQPTAPGASGSEDPSVSGATAQSGAGNAETGESSHGNIVAEQSGGDVTKPEQACDDSKTLEQDSDDDTEFVQAYGANEAMEDVIDANNEVTHDCTTETAGEQKLVILAPPDDYK